MEALIVQLKDVCLTVSLGIKLLALCLSIDARLSGDVT